MFIDLTEFLRCPADHEQQSLCVLVPDRVLDRTVHSGFIGCPMCRREYRIVDGAVLFDDPSTGDASLVAASSRPDPETIQAVMGLTGPGGYVVLVGSAARHAEPLTRLLDGVHLVVVNPSEQTSASTGSVLYCREGIPLRDDVARSVVLGTEYAGTFWLREAVRVLLKGLRLVVLSAESSVEGVEQMAVGEGVWVGRKA